MVAESDWGWPISADLENISNGWILQVRRLWQERRPDKDFDRLIGQYRVVRFGKGALGGTTVERGGPGDNGPTGRASRRCIAAGVYPLLTRATDKYSSTKYRMDGAYPWPALQVGDTSHRTGILVHPADGYCKSIGCVLISGPIDNADGDMVLEDSLRRLDAIIKDLVAFRSEILPSAPGTEIASAFLVVEDVI